MKKSLIFILLVLFLPVASADTLTLKSGKTVTGKIVEETAEYLKLDFQGVTIKYFKDEIESFEKKVEVAYGLSVDHLQFLGQRVRIDVYNPGAGTEKRPVVILIHGAAGIKGDRAVRYKGFAQSLMNRGMIAINVHYFDSQKQNWVKTFIKAIDYAQTIPNADKTKIGVVGYSLGGGIALRVASWDKRVTALVVNSGYLPAGFTKSNAASLPTTYILSGTEDKSINTLYTIQKWFKELGKPFRSKIDQGMGHTIPMNLFNQNWRTIVNFFAQTFGLAR
ncbi:MAG: dienelactone hydrolase family protein [Candidatus Omnitrophica bacterium]|nr:dienelactone hydrolase family protein [Candidatus Omnitrophota bacterium]